MCYVLKVLLIIFKINVFCLAYNYCYGGNEKKLCSNSTVPKHIACHEDLLERQGILVALIPMTKKLRNITLYTHNECRNNLAAGNLANEAGAYFPKAAHLREFIWDRELAYVASYQAMYCTDVHDECRNTKRFRFSGQNIGSTYSFLPLIISDVLEECVQTMCDQGKRVIYPYEFPTNLPKDTSEIESFAILANDQVSRVGCSMAYCRNCTSGHCYYVTCNYDFGYRKGEEVYEIDLRESASKCDVWQSIKSNKFVNLCKNNPDMFVEK